MTEIKENALSTIDKIIDNNETMCGSRKEVSLHAFISRNEKYRKRMIRAFGSVKDALIAYGYYDESKQSTLSDEQLTDFLLLNIERRHSGRVDIPSSKKEWLHEWYDVENSQYAKCLKEARRQFRENFIIGFFENTDYCDIAEELRKDRKEGLPMFLSKSVEDCFGTHKNFYASFGIDYRLAVDIENPLKVFGTLGRKFERAVLSIFEYQRITVIYNRQQAEGCRPDFVLSDRWADTKLSKSTIFSAADKALEKYLEHTDKLDIIYAIDDVSDEELPELPEGVRLVNVFDYFDEIPSNIKSELNRIIQEANDKRTKRRGRWAV